MSKKILIIDTPYVNLKSNNRSNYIPKLLVNNGYEVEKVCSDFNHKKKKIVTEINEDVPYKVTLLKTISYKKNVSLKRYLSQKIFSWKLKKYLKDIPKPDVIYNFIPSLDVGDIVQKYAKKNNIKLIIDVRDLWPEAFKMKFDFPIISDMLFFPQKIKANKIYRAADEIIAVSDTYKNRALKVNEKVNEAHTIYLGTELKEFDKYIKDDEIDSEKILLTYVGTLGQSYDLRTTFDALEILNNKGINNFKILIFGDGPLRAKFENYANKKNINVKFYGMVPYSDMVNMISNCDIALNPISKGASQSIINKHADYAAAGLAVINTQECEEYRNLIDQFNVGLNCENNNPTDMANKIKYLLNHKDERNKMGQNHRKLAEERFDREKTYKKIIELI